VLLNFIVDIKSLALADSNLWFCACYSAVAISWW